DERAGRDELEPASADVVQRAGDEPRPEPASLEGGIDLRVDELDHPGSDAVLDHARALVADPQLVAMLGGVVDDARFRSGAQEPSARSRASSMVSDRKSTRLNSSHVAISYAVFCLKKK